MYQFILIVKERERHNFIRVQLSKVFYYLSFYVNCTELSIPIPGSCDGNF